jgi:hypothetical protein
MIKIKEQQMRLFVNVQDQNHHLDRFLGEHVSYFLEVIKEFTIKYNKDKLPKNISARRKSSDFVYAFIKIRYSIPIFRETMP